VIMMIMMMDQIVVSQGGIRHRDMQRSNKSQCEHAAVP
jgi:hypothetical protein